VLYQHVLLNVVWHFERKQVVQGIQFWYLWQGTVNIFYECWCTLDIWPGYLRNTGVRSPTEAEDFSSSLYVQTGSRAHPAACTVGTGGPFPGGKARPGRDADHSPTSSAEVKNE
jgi:hypothetical protein